MRTTIIASLALLLTGCGGIVSGGENESEEDVVIQKEQYGAKVYQVANLVITQTRPKATKLLTASMNIVLANNSILSTTVESEDVERQIFSPLTNGKPTTVCPYLTKTQAGGAALSCRYLVDRAVEAALLDSTKLRDTIEQDVGQQNKDLASDELKYVQSWVNEAVLSGIDSGAAHAIKLLRDAKTCDQAPTPTQSAYKLGESQGKALLEAAEKTVLPTIPKTQCATDIIASTIRAEANKQVQGFIKAHPICAGYNAADLAVAVDMAGAEQSRKKGLDEGVRLAYEALRVRLVSSWKCTACKCYIRYSGKGPTQCFRTNSSSHPKTLIAQGVPMVKQSECSAAPVPVGSPLVFDLDDNGVKLSRQRIAFDIAATGDMARIPALTGRDALLALDLDGNGRIDSGAELFGNATRCGSSGRCTDGLEALAQHDANRDGRIDRRDPVFARLRLWRDADRNGVSQATELTTLAAAGIRSVGLSARLDLSWVDAQGNSATRALSFTRTDGTVGQVPDVWFSLKFDRLPSNPRSSGVVSTLLTR